MPHQGSWGLPDFGITEGITSLFGLGRTAEGGSNLSGGNDTVLVPTNFGTNTSYYNPQVLGASTNTSGSNNYSEVPYTPYTAPQTSPTSPTGGTQQIPSNPTGNNNNNTGSTGSAEETYLSQLRSGLDSAYQPVFEGLDRLAGWLPEWQNQKMESLNQLFSSQNAGINEDESANKQKLEGYRGDIRTEQKQNLKSLGEQLRNWGQAGMNQLGTWGAGDSSAAGMYRFGLAKEAAKRGTDIARQVSGMFNELRQKEMDITTTSQKARRDLEQWKTTNVQSITDEFNNKLQAIQEQRMNATGAKAQALQQGTLNLMQQAYSRLQQIQDQASQWENGLKEWAINRMSSLDDVKVQLGQMSQYSPQEIVWKELQGANNISAGNGGLDAMWNPYNQKARQEEEKFNSIWG